MSPIKQRMFLVKLLPLQVFFNILYYLALAPFYVSRVDNDNINTNGEFQLKRTLTQMVLFHKIKLYSIRH